MIKRLVTLTVLAVATALLLAAACSSEKEETSTTDISQDQQDSKIQLKMTGAEDSRKTLHPLLHVDIIIMDDFSSAIASLLTLQNILSHGVKEVWRK